MFQTTTSYDNEKVKSCKKATGGMTRKSHTTWARLYSAVNDLATGRGSLQNRLYYAFVTLSHLKTEAFPEELQADFESVKQALTSVNPGTDKSLGEVERIEATALAMDDSSAEAMAKKIVDIFNRIARKYCQDD